MRKGPCVLLGVSAWSAASVVCAQQGANDEASRAAMLRTAYELSTRVGDHGRALRLAQEAAAIRVTPSLRLFLSEEHEFLSREADGGAHLLDAAREASQCIRDAAATPVLTERERIVQSCTRVLNRINTRVARVRVRVEAPASETVRVRLRGESLDPSQWNTSLPLLPGEVLVEADREGHAPFMQRLQTVPGSAYDVTVAWPEAHAAVPRHEVLAPPPPVTAHPSTVLRVVGWSTLGVGVVAGVVAAMQWARTSDQASLTLESADADGQAWTRYVNAVNPDRARSLDDVCDQAARDAGTVSVAARVSTLCESNRNARTMAWGFGIGGAALVAAGVTMLVLAHGSRTVEVAPVVTAGLTGATLRVGF